MFSPVSLRSWRLGIILERGRISLLGQIAGYVRGGLCISLGSSQRRVPLIILMTTLQLEFILILRIMRVI